MKELLSSLPLVHQQASAGYVQALIQIHRQELFTGIMSMSYPSNEMLALVFWEGLLLNLYHCLEGKNPSIPRPDWQTELNRPDAAVRQLPLTVEELRVFRVMFESVIDHTDSAAMTATELKSGLMDWQELEEESLVWARSGQRLTMGLIAGFGDPTFEGVDLLGESTHFFRQKTESTDVFSEGQYDLVRYACSRGQTAWREHGLRLAFNQMMQMLINRFGELAGRILAERLCVQLSNWCVDGGFRISLGTNGVEDRQFFESLNHAVDAYVGIIRRFQDESSLAIGPRLAENLQREVLGKLTSHPRGLLIEHIYSRYGLSDFVFEL